MEEQPKTAVITDWRFKHEYHKMNESFGDENIVTIRVERKGLNIIDDITEHDLDDFLDFDFIIPNNGSLQDLEERARITAENIQNIHLKRKITETFVYFPYEGVIKHKIWFKDQEIYREDGPAFTEYYSTGGVKTKMYFLNSMLHREDGPTVEKYTPDGKIISHEYYLSSKKTSKNS